MLGSFPCVIMNGLTARNASKNGSMSTIRSFSSGRPLIGSTVISVFLAVTTSLTNTLQPRRFRPLIRIASEPQMPCAQERRKVRLPSMYHLM